MRRVATVIHLILEKKMFQNMLEGFILMNTGCMSMYNSDSYSLKQ